MENIRTLDFYGFDGDNTMYDTNSYPISKASELENEKYVKETEDTTNDETEPTVDSGETPTTESTETSGETPTTESTETGNTEK